MVFFLIFFLLFTPILTSHHTFCSFFPHIQSSRVCTGGYYDHYDLQQHQTFMNVNPGFQESEHNALRYTQGGPQGNAIPFSSA